MILADLGAEVVKVEPPGGDETRRLGGVYWSVYNRGKKTITLDVQTEIGVAIVKELVPHFDVVTQNFRPGIIDAIGLGYDVLSKLNTGMIMVNVSGFGQHGRYHDRAGYDPIGQAMSGLMNMTGGPDDPPMMTASPIIDRITALHAAIGALGALHHRDRTGEGQALEVCLLDAGYSLMEIPLSNYLLTGHEPTRAGNGQPEVSPYNAYEARDGWVYIMAVPQKMFVRLCRVIGRTDLANDPRFASMPDRGRNRHALDAILAEWVGSKTADEVSRLLETANVPFGQVNSIRGAAEDPYRVDREVLVETTDGSSRTFVPGLYIKYSKTPGGIGPIGSIGQHNEEIYRGLLGHSGEEVERWRSSGVI
jgi:crotonobetainyl-CoA:carnitine CoA-transferase CaiB-like acyl-CoA transferase